MADERIYRTSEIARETGVHPNTVRKYEEWGYIPPAHRTPSGYRQFTAFHLDQMKLARLAMLDGWPGRELRRISLDLIRSAATGALAEAAELGNRYRSLLKDEIEKAEMAADILEHWAQEPVTEEDTGQLRIRETARLLNVTTDMLRHWERNGLIKVPQNPRNRYRLYGIPEIRRLRVIRMLVKAGYSTMSILRMLIYLDGGHREGLRRVLDTPGPDEDIFNAADTRLSSLHKWEQQVERMIDHLKRMIRKYDGI